MVILQNILSLWWARSLERKLNQLSQGIKISSPSGITIVDFIGLAILLLMPTTKKIIETILASYTEYANYL